MLQQCASGDNNTCPVLQQCVSGDNNTCPVLQRCASGDNNTCPVLQRCASGDNAAAGGADGARPGPHAVLRGLLPQRAAPAGSDQDVRLSLRQCHSLHPLHRSLLQVSGWASLPPSVLALCKGEAKDTSGMGDGRFENPQFSCWGFEGSVLMYGSRGLTGSVRVQVGGYL